MRSLGSDASGVKKGDLVVRHGDWTSRGDGGECILAFVGRKERGWYILHQIIFTFSLDQSVQETGRRSWVLGMRSWTCILMLPTRTNYGSWAGF